ncbi:dihydropteroate synthase [Rubripirellula amarantea]|uniref:Dihydropteroate synthase n=1 Tax=Rubripirellula amarantea TaxID=2527999 RepID=A0A5C5WQN9_9BACT|nr:dihydropteroate synthase [Rubripirellula amarantea]MDA8744987.1 dihydropteroate synthase [Rubripirellula amarantea]TWT52857.1 Dihydropteroate synthase [Rubripirellula amarantea]
MPTAPRWTLKTRSLEFARAPLVMGILNVTPDSFSDGGKHLALATAVESALQMQADGAAIIDIGGESTRPYSDPVGVEEELSRVIPVIEQLKGRLKIPISIDTSKAEVARQALAEGAEIINDVTGLEGDPAMIKVASQSKAGVCVMHMQGTPQTMQDRPSYDDVAKDVYRYLKQRKEYCLDAGIDENRICLDPGIGFGKTHEQNLELLRHMPDFLDLGSPILIGHSRKGFIAKVIGDSTQDRMAGTLGVTLAAAVAGMHVVRVHDVLESVQAIKLFETAGGFTFATQT